MKLYLVRHGETDWNREKRYYGSFDIGLNEKGEQQARQVGALLQDKVFDTLYTSPLLRAKQTLSHIQASNKQTNEEKKRESKLLTEQALGFFEGYTYRQLQEKFPKELQRWNQNWKEGTPNGESFRQLYGRVQRFCQEELQIDGVGSEAKQGSICVKEDNRQANIIIVSHEAVFRCLCTMLFHMEEDAVWNFTFEQGAYSRIDIEDGYAIIKKINQSK